MSGPLRPGMVVRSGADSTQQGLIVDLRFQEPGHVPLYDVEWVGSGDAQNQSSTDFIRGATAHVTAGEKFGKLEVLEVDMTAEVMKVRVGEHRLPNWIDVRLTALPASWATRADQVREAWIAADRAKLDWFKPGQIVENAQGKKALSRPATVIGQVAPGMVQVITSNGLADVPFDQLMLSANSVQDLQAKYAQKQQSVMEAFKTEVREKVMDAKDEHDLCNEGVQDFLQALGIKTPVRKVRAVLHLTVEVEAVLNDGTGMSRLDLDRASNKDWWSSTLEFADDGKDLNLKDDDDVDMGSVEVRLVSSRVDEIHDESYMEGEQ